MRCASGPRSALLMKMNRSKFCASSGVRLAFRRSAAASGRDPACGTGGCGMALAISKSGIPACGMRGDASFGSGIFGIGGTGAASGDRSGMMMTLADAG